MDWSAWIRISMADAGAWDDWLIDGRSMVPGATSGAVIMKMTRSTSMTSIYGTTLISDMLRRSRPPRIDVLAKGPAISARLTQQDVGKLLDEALEADRESVSLVDIAVVSDDSRDSRE